MNKIVARNKNLIISLYEVEKKNIKEISTILEFPISTVRRLLLEEGVEIRSKNETQQLIKYKLINRPTRKAFKMSEHSRKLMSEKAKLRGKGTRINSNGYVEMTKQPHTGKLYHRYIVENHIGRKLLKNEQIHHIDGNKLNNCLSNLQILDKNEHMRLHRLQEIRERTELGQFKKGVKG